MRSLTSAGTLALLLGFIASSAAEPPVPHSDKDRLPAPSQAGTDANNEVRRAAEKLLREIDLEIRRDDKWNKVERIEEPLLFYGEPTRNNDRGSVWGWGRVGRPVALMELWQNPDQRAIWRFAICNTSGSKLRAHHAGAPWWQENDSMSELKDIPGAPVPAASSAPRQRQLKLLAANFAGHEFWDPANTRYELRLLKRPLRTYRDEANEVLEGGLFTLANGTNPEIMFFVEARTDPKDRSKSVWQYTVGRLAHAELHLEYNGKEVFEAANGFKVSASDQPYWLGRLPAAVDADSEKP
jgi:hypothetical protein